MSKSTSYLYHGTKGHIVEVASSFPKNPNELLSNGWIEVTHPDAAKNSSSREFYESDTKLRVRFDSGKGGAAGFEGIDHYHIRNPDRTGKSDEYLDIHGNPVARGSKASHILPKED